MRVRPPLALERVYSADGRIQEGLPRAPARLRPKANAGHEVKVFSVQKGKARCSHVSGGALALVRPNRPERRLEEWAGPKGPLLGCAACPGAHRRTPGPVREKGGLSAPSSQRLGAHKGGGDVVRAPVTRGNPLITHQHQPQARNH